MRLVDGCSNADLLGLLPDNSFPAEPFGSEPALLAALRQVGLQTRASPAALVEMAAFVASLANADERDAHARCLIIILMLNSSHLHY